MIIFLAGGVSGNLKPAWHETSEPTPDSFVKALHHENFWQGGESRHWVHEASPVKENETISCRDNVRESIKDDSCVRGGVSLTIRC